MNSINTSSDTLSPPFQDGLPTQLRNRQIEGLAYARELSGAMDDILQTLAHKIFGEKAPEDFAVLALGGYGRAELCPFSDIDILFLSRGAGGTEAEKIQMFLYALWDQGLKIGHATRTIGECLNVAREDSRVMTSLFDGRTVYGDETLNKTLQHELTLMQDRTSRQDYIRSKLDERDARHARFGDTRYVLEPNIKEGKGGLRDFQTLLWLARCVYGAQSLDDLARLGILTAREAASFSKDYNFLMTVRCHLHDLAGRAEERLHFDIQPDLAARLGYRNGASSKAVERFMKHFFLVTKDIGDLTRILCAAIENEESDEPEERESFFGFETHQGRIGFGAKQDLKSHPTDMLRLFRVAQETGKSIHPKALKDITRNIRRVDDMRNDPLANRLFLEILCARRDASLTLRRMNEAGVLGRFIPDFGRIIALMQFDRYHHFTVDEHILHCIDMLHKIERGECRTEAPVVSDIIHDIQDRQTLHVALFLHDIAKGRGGDHSELGAELALSLCPRFGLSGAETDLVSWLVLDHLAMSDTAFKRNLNDPKTIADFSARVRSKERLDLLFVLTAADIMGVGPGRWTAWKAALLEELYEKTCLLMEGREPGMTVEIVPPKDLKPGETRILIEDDSRHSATRIVVFTPDRPGLFATLCGALTAEGANIIRAHIDTLPGKLAVDSFIVQNSKGLPFVQPRRQDDLHKTLMGAIEQTLDIDARLADKRRPAQTKDMVFDIPVDVHIDNKASASDSVIEISARDRLGLLYDMASVFRDRGLDIRAAKINTMGLRVVDVFYVQTQKRKKLINEALQESLIEALKTRLNQA